ncbi:MAG: DUF4062 domain-containing protein, partial [Chloroflexota bacterium]|nr:DUF4062 domain-containing protein [Chloroflexota bacterium]
MTVKVFVSSTSIDLERHRRAVEEVINRLGQQYQGMEHFGSRPQEPTEACLQEVGRCDLFVGIYAHRYGHIPPGQPLSITELEFDCAVRLKKPCYYYRAAPGHPWPPNFIDEGEAKARLQAFLQDKVDRLVRTTFTTPENLGMQVAADLGRHMSQVTGQALMPVPVLIPCPPDPYFAHPYPLQENFTGRIPERQALTEWLAQDPRPMLAMVAIGGMGKSALAWYWLQEDILRGGRGPEGALWWSFYDRDSAFEAFLERGILYASGGQIDPSQMPSVRERMDCLKNLLYQRPFLLALDGVERVLRAYASLKAPYQGDTLQEDPRGDFRACADPNLGLFLQWMASGYPRTKTLLTSRLLPRELDALEGCRPMELPQMDADDAVEFFHRQGVRGTRAEIEAACRPYGYHPLCLRLLSGLVAYDPQRPGDMAQASRYNPLPQAKGKEQHHILEVAYQALDPKKRDLLSRLAAFRTPLDYQGAALFNPFRDTAAFEAALVELVGRGLLLFQRETGRYDMHPVVRAYAYDRLRDKEGVHTRLADYFAALPRPEEARSLEDLAPVIELYYHTVGAGRYDQARDLYYDRLNHPLYYHLGAYVAVIELLGGLFPDGQEKGPRLKDERAQAWTLNSLADA